MSVPINEVLEFMTQGTKHRFGLVVFAYSVDKRVWLADHGVDLIKIACYRTASSQWFTEDGAYLSLVTYEGFSEFEYKLRGFRFDKVWTDGELPEKVRHLIESRKW